MIKQIKTIFFGTSDFAVPILKKILTTDYCKLMAVVTQPDKPMGREQKLKASPIKELALKNKISVLQPVNIKDRKVIKNIKDLGPDLIITAAYGQIIPKKILKIPKRGSINIHGSLLPKYRGASPIQTAILEGEKETGITIMLMDEKLDHGPIISQEKIKITSKDTAGILHDKLAKLGAKLLIKTLPKWLDNKIKSRPQDHKGATFTKILTREDGKIDWKKSATEIERQVRAFDPWPRTWTTWGKKRLKILKVKTLDSKVNKPVGKVFFTDKKLAVTCAKGNIILEQIQLEGKKKMSSKEFLKGYPKIVGKTLK